MNFDVFYAVCSSLHCNEMFYEYILSNLFEHGITEYAKVYLQKWSGWSLLS